MSIIKNILNLLNPKKIDSIPELNKINYKENLDYIQREIHKLLKEYKFKKRGRTHNRESEKGIIQVINFQMGQYPIGENYVIPGYRENHYGKFTINLGVYVDELYKISFPKNEKKFIQEYDCNIRYNLSRLINEEHFWWDLSQNKNEIIENIKENLLNKGFEWFEQFENREKICENLNENSKTISPDRAKLDKALIFFYRDKVKGTKLFNEYYDNLKEKPNGHKKYVRELSEKLKIKLKNYS